MVAVHDREDRLCELVDGVLVEKAVGYYAMTFLPRLVTGLCLLQFGLVEARTDRPLFLLVPVIGESRQFPEPVPRPRAAISSRSKTGGWESPSG